MNDVTPIILAGGLGSRLRTVLGEVPKVLAPINGRPFLSLLMDGIADTGFKGAVLCTGYQSQRVANVIGDRHGEVRVVYSTEKEPLGTGGAVRDALPVVKTPYVLIMNGDTWSDINLYEYMTWFKRKQYDASMVVSIRDDCCRYGQVLLDASNLVVAFVEKGRRKGVGLVNAGIYMFKTSILKSINTGAPVSLEKEYLPTLIPDRLYGYKIKGAFIDIGTPESYASAERFLSTRRAVGLDPKRGAL